MRGTQLNEGYNDPNEGQGDDDDDTVKKTASMREIERRRRFKESTYPGRRGPQSQASDGQPPVTRSASGQM